MSTDEIKVTVRKLTLGEVRKWYEDLLAGECGDWIQELALPDISLLDLARMTDKTAVELEDLTSSELAKVAADAQTMNPSVFRLRQYIREGAREIEREFNDAIERAAK